MKVPGYVIRDVTAPEAMHDLEDVQVAAWGYRDREVAEMGPDAAFEDWAALPGLVRDLLD